MNDTVGACLDSNAHPARFNAGLLGGKLTQRLPVCRCRNGLKTSPIWRRVFLLVSAGLLALGTSVVAQFAGSPALPDIPTGTYSIANYGAIGDGVATNTAAIQAALDAAMGAGGGTVDVPPGTFLSGPIRFGSRINLRLEAHAILRMLPLEKYPGGTINPANFITGANLHDISISGSGVIDGQARHGGLMPGWGRRPHAIRFSTCQRVLIENVTLSNSPMFHISVSSRSSDVTVRGVTIRATPSTDPVNPGHNTDACDVGGKHPQENRDSQVGDDDFTCSGGTSDVLITNCTFGYGHGVSIGSPTSGGVSNFMVVINFCQHRARHSHQIRPRPGRLSAQSQLLQSAHDERGLSHPHLRLLQRHQSPLPRADRYHAGHCCDVVWAPPSPSGRRSIAISPSATSPPRCCQGIGRELIWGLPEMTVSDVLLEKVTITADKPVRRLQCAECPAGGSNHHAGGREQTLLH